MEPKFQPLDIIMRQTVHAHPQTSKLGSAGMVDQKRSHSTKHATELELEYRALAT